MSIDFKVYMEDEFHVYHHVAIDEKIVRRHWQGLFNFLHDDEHEMIFEKFGIRTIENREEVAIYLGFIWRLVREFTILAVPSFYSEEVAQCLNKKYKVVKWEYDVESEANKLVDKGFVPAVSLGKSGNADLKHAGIFEIKTFEELVDLQKALLSKLDANTATALYCLKDNNIERILSSLNSVSKPRLGDCLDAEELLIHLVLGADLGFHDSLLIKSRRDISEFLHNLVTEYNNSIKEYEANVGNIKTIRDFIETITRLIHVQ